ncbi:MAG: SDR family oxidoreductase [Deltaproteobacteria bacterium]|nr:SDR family oxidoreductase [Deltaproteobacteria bacterium]
MSRGLSGRVAIVSGVGPGLGIELVRGLAREGARLVLCDVDANNLEAAGREAAQLGAAHVEGLVDIRDGARCEALVANALAAFGRIDVLVNDAFLAEAPATFEDASLGDWQAVADVNLWGTLRMIKAALPALKRAGDACIVNVNTHGVERLDREFGGYTASKAALAHLTRHLAREFGPFGIRVNGVHPGPMDGEPRRRHLATIAAELGTSFEVLDAEARGRTSLGFLATPADVADAVLFLASPAARAITGQALYVDGGEWFH